MTAFQPFIEQSRDRVNAVLARWLQDYPSADLRLNEAMHYCLLDGGKRVRPVLCYAAANVISEINDATDAAAAAVECIHTYSLVHDDLPAMDDDDLRRGKPSSHIAFDEATAILVGDALQSLAFEQLALASEHDPVTGLKLVKELASAAGPSGMVLGQCLDMAAEKQSAPLSLPNLEALHRKKTGALIVASARMGAITAGANPDDLAALEDYARALGLAFQVRDDILDVSEDTSTLGKPKGSDEAAGKSTYVSLLGIENAQQKLQALSLEAKQALAPFAGRASCLRALADYVTDRRS